MMMMIRVSSSNYSQSIIIRLTLPSRRRRTVEKQAS